jgi:iron transport multicopper oxidase
VLLQILSGAQTAQELLPQGSVYSLPPNKVIQLSLPAAGVVGIGEPVSPDPVVYLVPVLTFGC